MQQLREYQFSKTVAFVRGTRIRQYVMFAARQTHRLTRLLYLAAEVIPSDKRINILEIYASHSIAAYYRPIRANARVSGSTSYCISS